MVHDSVTLFHQSIIIHCIDERFISSTLQNGNMEMKENVIQHDRWYTTNPHNHLPIPYHACPTLHRQCQQPDNVLFTLCLIIQSFQCQFQYPIKTCGSGNTINLGTAVMLVLVIKISTSFAVSFTSQVGKWGPAEIKGTCMMLKSPYSATSLTMHCDEYDGHRTVEDFKQSVDESTLSTVVVAAWGFDMSSKAGFF